MDISSTTSQVSTPTEAKSSAPTQKASSNSEASFKEEMSKVSDNSDKAETNQETKSEKQGVAVKTENSEKLDTDMTNASAEKHLEHSDDLKDTVLLSGEISVQDPNAQIAQNFNKQDMLNTNMSIAQQNDNFGNVTNMQDFCIDGMQGAFDPNMQAQALIDANVMLSEVVYDAKTPVKIDYKTVEMDMNDAQFFTELVQDTDKTLKNVVTELTQNSEADVKEIQKNIKVSATLMNALSEAVKNKQSFRIDFDKDISVIIKVDRDGAITARFIPGDSAVEQYLKQNLSTLRQRFDEQDLAYNELSYTGQQKRNRKNNNNNKENGHE